METPSGHPSSPTQISTNSKQPKTPHSELSQVAPQTQTSKHRYRNTPTRNPPQTLCITIRTKAQLPGCVSPIPVTITPTGAQLPTHPLHPLTKQNPSRRQMKQTIFENTSFTTNLDTNKTNTSETTVQRNIREIHHSIVQNYLQ